MCGIVGIVSHNNCVNEIVSGLNSLEYRGYDSCGITALNGDVFSYKKSVKKISHLEKEIDKGKIKGNIVIGHTRWATHGKPSLTNCHPFIKDNCALVHNGIIENFEQLINNYSLDGKNIISETDSEVIAEIFNKLLNKYNNPIEAIRDLTKKILGTFSLGFLVKGSNTIYATRKGSPLVLGLSDTFNSISSDLLGLPEETKEILFLEENDIATINKSSISIYDIENNEVKREKHQFVPKKDFKVRGDFKHFMEKEIFHQPISMEDTILNFADQKIAQYFFRKMKLILAMFQISFWLLAVRLIIHV